MKCDYDQGSYWTRNRSSIGDRRMSFRDRGRGRFFKIMDKITDRIIEGDHKTITEMTLGEEIMGRCKIIEVRIIEVDVETIIEMKIELTILEQAEVGLGKDVTHVTLRRTTEAKVHLHQGQAQDQD